MIEYSPHKVVEPRTLKLISCPTAWTGLETIVEDILTRFDVGRKLAIDFGIYFGYSTAVFANYFDYVIGVDNFKGENQVAQNTDELYSLAKTNLRDFKNIEVVNMDYRQFIKKQKSMKVDLIHVDIEHNFEHTYRCGLWAAKHSKVTLFHDTESFAQFVKPAIEKIAEETGKTFYNFPYYHGLGILVRE